MNKAIGRRWGAAACGLAALSLLSSAPLAAADPISDAVAGLPVTAPKIKYILGDNLDPLPKDAPLPSSDPRNFEGNWAGVGGTISVDGNPAPYQPAVREEMARLKALSDAGTPAIKKNALCRPNGPLAFGGNQFPTQVLQSADKLIVIAEEGRSIWDIRIGGKHGAHEVPAYGGNSVAHWEGNVLVVDSILHTPRATTGSLAVMAGTSSQLHLTTRIMRATTGSDPVNGARLLVYQTYDDPGIFTRPWSTLNVARWRPDLQLMDFNCEESSEDEINEGLVVEK